MSDMTGIEIKDIFGLSEPLTKLVDTVSAGIGRWYEPIHVRRMAEAKAEELNAISDATRMNSDLEVNYQYGNIQIATTDEEKLLQRAQNRQKFQQVKKQKNIESVVAKAYAELENEDRISEEPVSEDWSTRFFGIVEDVSAEEMQVIWARILAGEIKRPGRFSLRLLETLRNLSSEEAKMFCQIIPCLMPNGEATFLPSYSDVLEKYGIKYWMVRKLDECGLIKADELSLHKSGDLCEFTFWYGSIFIKFEMKKKEKKSIIKGFDARIGGYFLTGVGYELLELSEKKYHSMEYLKDVVKSVRKALDYGYEVTARVCNLNDDEIAFDESGRMILKEVVFDE